MAGFYPDAPTRRIAWDLDGTVVHQVRFLAFPASLGHYTTTFRPPVEAWSDMSAGDKQAIQDETPTGRFLDGSPGDDGVDWISLMFPELRDVDGYFFNMANESGACNVSQNIARTSSNTTNGRDGVFATFDDETFSSVSGADDYRENITLAAEKTRRNIQTRLSFSCGGTQQGAARIRRLHLYGEIAAGETPDRLLFIDETTGLEFTKPKDYGDVPAGSARDIKIRMKNNSSTLTANTVDLSFESFDGGGSDGWYTLTDTPNDVSTFAATYQIPALGPGTVSALLTLREIVPDSATLGAHAARIRQETTGGWT